MTPPDPAKKPAKPPWRPETYLRTLADTQHARMPGRWLSSPAYRLLSGGAKSALLALGLLLSGPGGTSGGQASYSEIAAHGAISRRGAVYAVAELAELGWVRVERKKTRYGSFDQNFYQVIPPAELGPGKEPKPSAGEAHGEAGETRPTRAPSAAEELLREWYAEFRPGVAPCRPDLVLARKLCERHGARAREVLIQAIANAKGWIPEVFCGLRRYLLPLLEGPGQPEIPAEQLAALEELGRLYEPFQHIAALYGLERPNLPMEQREIVGPQLYEAEQHLALSGRRDLTPAQLASIPAALAQVRAAIAAAEAAIGRV